MTPWQALMIPVAHMIGDYLLQSDWMATNKLKRWWPAVAHGITYTIPYLLVTRNPWALLIIGGTHIVLDHYRAARYVVWLKNQIGAKRRYVYRTSADDPMFGEREWEDRYNGVDHMGARPIHATMSVAPPHARRVRVDPMAWPPTATGYPAGTPAGLATALLIVADNTIHLMINIGAVLWFG